MSHRPLVLVLGLTVGDYLLWNWSLGANHDVLALVSGLTLPPLVVASLWLLALSVARLLARVTRRPSTQAGGHARHRPATTAATDAAAREPSSSTKPAGSSSRKLAA